MMQRAVGASALLLCSSICLANIGSAQETVPQESATNSAPADSSSAAALAAEIWGIAYNQDLSFTKKEKRIAGAVRLAVIAATEDKSDDRQNLDIALELAEAASRAAPRFTEVIVNAAVFSPVVSRINGSAGEIRAVAFAAAREGDADAGAPRPQSRVRSRTRHVNTRPFPPASDEEAGTPRTSYRSTTPKVDGEYADNTPMDAISDGGATSPLAGNYAFHAKADITVRHDDNVYLSKGDKTSDVIVSLTPGVDFSFGQNSLTHGFLGYQVEFLRYVNDSAPSARLSHVLANFGYTGATLSLSASGSYNQAYQNNRDVLVEGNSALVRSNSLNLGASGEGSITPKMSLKTGVSYAKTEYPAPAAPPPPAEAPTGLIGNKIFSVPLNIYYNITPKTDLSIGATYSSVKPESDGPGGYDIYYNVGMRGEFTPKLTGEFSVGYRKRKGDNGTDDSLLGYNGAFTYELTPKTSAALQLGRDFTTSATGESLQNASYGLKVNTVFTPQLEAGISILYRQVDYGLQFFEELSTTPPARRKDNYWEGTLSFSYIFSSWLTTTAGYTLRNNSSADNPGVEFSNSLLSLMVGLRY